MRIQDAYRLENGEGSKWTAPLKKYNQWFQSKIESAESPQQKAAWKAGYAASVIFAYLILGPLALVGIAINLWGRTGKVEDFCSRIRNELLFVQRTGKSRESFFSQSSSSRDYSYSQGQRLTFDITEPSRVDGHMAHIQNEVRTLSQKYRWIPETLYTNMRKERVVLVIPIPDHIIF